MKIGADPTGASAVAARIRLVRLECFGEGGAAEVAGRLGLPLRDWLEYESGAAIPCEVLLGFLDLTGAEASWLLGGTGERYRPGRGPGA